MEKWYVTHAGLLRLAFAQGCLGIAVSRPTERLSIQMPVAGFSKPLSSRAPLQGIRWLWRCRSLKRFFPSARRRNARGRNSRCQSRPAKGLRDRPLFGRRVGRVLQSAEIFHHSIAIERSHSSNGSGNGQPRLRDQLCLLIRQYNLDSNLVKAYAADFCGTEALSGASRELVESFISHLSSAAKENRDALICKLNSYAQPVEVNS